jgi:hypothetical protein
MSAATQNFSFQASHEVNVDRLPGIAEKFIDGFTEFLLSETHT